MIRNTLQIIEYVDNKKFEVIRHYRDKYKEPLRSKNLWVTVRRLFDIIGPQGVYPVEHKYRQKVVIKSLNQMTSDSYIESRIDWNEYNNLNGTIDNLSLDDIEEEAYRDIKEDSCDICNRCC